MTELIIHAPHLQSAIQRITTTTITLAFWALWCFLWTPLVTLFAWLSGIELIYVEMVELGGYKSLLAELYTLSIGIGTMTGSLVIWATYNFHRFKNNKQRGTQKPVSNQELAQFFKVEEKSIPSWKNTKHLSVSFDESGNIKNVTPWIVYDTSHPFTVYHSRIDEAS